MKKIVMLAAAAAVAMPASAFAVTGDVQFDGSVSNTCAITVNSAGTLATNVGQTVLGSEQAGGAAGRPGARGLPRLTLRGRELVCRERAREGGGGPRGTGRQGRRRG